MTTPQTNLPDQNAGTSPMQESPPVQAEMSAWRSPWSHLLLWGLAALGLTIDLVSKHLAFERLPSQPYPLIRGILSLDRSMNFGALFGIGRGKTGVFILASIAAILFVTYMFITSRRRQWVVHVALGLVLAGALGNLYDRLFVKVDVVMKGDHTQTYGLLTPDQTDDGIRIGRYPDVAPPFQYFPLTKRYENQQVPRVEQRTAVRDFIRVDLSINTRWTGPMSIWPWIFNVADSMLVVGVSLLLIIYWRHPAARVEPPAPAPQQIDNCSDMPDGQNKST